MNRKNGYSDIALWRETCRKQKQRYYEKTATHEPVPWTQEDLDLIVKHEKPDTELSRLTGQSVRAIQVKRSRLKNQSQKRRESVCLSCE